MSKASYPYPDDEFDAPPDADGPRGVHRAPRSAWRRWWPFLVVVLVVPAVAWGVVTLAARNGIVPGVAPGAQVTASDGASGPAEDAPDDGSTDAAGSTPSAPAQAPSTPAPVPSAPAVALGTPVKVVNVAGISGLAATAQGTLTKAGFTAVTTGNGSKGTLKTSTVFYASADLKATADKVASTLGLTAVVQSTDKSGGAITVTLLSKLP